MSSGNKAKYIILAMMVIVVLISGWGCTKSVEGISKYFPAKVDKNDKWGMVDINGSILFEKQFEEQPAPEFEGMTYVKNKDGEFEYYTVAKSPQKVGGKFYDASPFSEGLAAVVAGKEDDKHIEYIDKTGKTKFKVEKLDGKKILGASRFNEGLAWVRNEDNKYGYIDKSGKLVIKCKYDEADLFWEGLARVSQADKDGDSKIGFINSKDKVIIPLKADRDYSRFSEGFCWFSDTNNAGETKSGTINKSGKIVIQPTKDIQTATKFQNGLSVFYDGNSAGLMNAKGKELVRPKYDGIIQLPAGMMVVSGDEFGMINSKGKEILPLTDDYDSFIPVSKGKFLAQEGSKWLIVNKKGKQLSKQKFEAFEIYGILGLEFAKDSVSFFEAPIDDAFGAYGDYDSDYGDMGAPEAPAPTPSY